MVLVIDYLIRQNLRDSSACLRDAYCILVLWSSLYTLSACATRCGFPFSSSSGITNESPTFHSANGYFFQLSAFRDPPVITMPDSILYGEPFSIAPVRFDFAIIIVWFLIKQKRLRLLR